MLLGSGLELLLPPIFFSMLLQTWQHYYRHFICLAVWLIVFSCESHYVFWLGFGYGSTQCVVTRSTSVFFFFFFLRNAKTECLTNSKKLTVDTPNHIRTLVIVRLSTKHYQPYGIQQISSIAWQWQYAGSCIAPCPQLYLSNHHNPVVSHPPYFPDPPPADLSMFSEPKIMLK